MVVGQDADCGRKLVVAWCGIGGFEIQAFRAGAAVACQLAGQGVCSIKRSLELKAGSCRWFRQLPNGLRVHSTLCHA